MTDRILQDGQVVAVNDQAEQLERMRGLGLTGDLAAAEAASWRRWVPGGRMPWRELVAFEEEILRLEERRRELEQERAEATAELQNAPSQDLDALAAWERGGRRGSRPESTRPALESKVGRLQEEERALLYAIDKVSSERAAYVAKHRGRLVSEAGQVAEKAHRALVRSLDQLEAARSELVEARRLTLWAELYPAAEVGREPGWQLLGGGLRRILAKVGLEHLVTAAAVLEGLREDAEWIASAATPEQRQAIEGARRLTPKELDRARSAELEQVGQLRGQLAHDQRAGELAAMRTKLK